MRFRNLAILISVPVLIAFAAFVVNQTNQVVLFFSSISPALGQVALWLLLACYAIIVIVPVILLVRLPTPLRPPETDTGPAFDRHLRMLRARLALNDRLPDRALETREDVEQALTDLKVHADVVIRESASVVFLTTAISQNGRLDGLVVLAAQSRMVWEIAHVYFQRPSLRDLVNLYANVAAAAFIAAQLEDIDVEEQIEPVVESMAGAAVGAVPGMTAAATILSSAILTGSTNAFLTLRVGVIAQRYCGSLVVPPRRSLRRVAAAEAARMLLPLVWEGSRRISSSTFRALRSRFGRRKRSADARKASLRKARRAQEQLEEELDEMESTQHLMNPEHEPESSESEQDERRWWNPGRLFG